ncbi:hypothetical protein D3C74_95540 [compost metagenome]
MASEMKRIVEGHALDRSLKKTYSLIRYVPRMSNRESHFAGTPRPFFQYRMLAITTYAKINDGNI